MESSRRKSDVGTSKSPNRPRTRSLSAASKAMEERQGTSDSVAMAAEALTMMNSSEEGDASTRGKAGSVAGDVPRKRREEKATENDSDIEIMPVAEYVASEEEAKRRALAVEARRIEKNRAADEKRQERERRAALRLARPKVEKSKLDATNKARREKYRQLVRRREADEVEKQKLAFERAEKAAKSARDRVASRRRDIPRELSAIARTKRTSHSMKIDSLARGNPLLVVENPRTKDICVQLTLDHLPRLGHGQWLNQTIIDWYLCFVSYQQPNCTVLGTDFYRLMSDKTKGDGPKFVIDHHRPLNMRGVLRGEDFCALERTRVIIVPVNVNGDHWVLVAIFPAERQVRYYDSLTPGPAGTSSSRKVVRRFMRWVELHEERRNGTMRDWEPVYVQGLSRQTNSWDCGVYVCDYAETIASGQDETKLFCTSEEQADRYRARLLIYILEASLLSY